MGRFFLITFLTGLTVLAGFLAFWRIFLGDAEGFFFIVGTDLSFALEKGQRSVRMSTEFLIRTDCRIIHQTKNPARAGFFTLRRIL